MEPPVIEGELRIMIEPLLAPPKPRRKKHPVSPTRAGSGRAEWHLVRVEDRFAMEPPTDQIGLWLRRNLLATMRFRLFAAYGSAASEAEGRLC